MTTTLETCCTAVLETCVVLVIPDVPDVMQTNVISFLAAAMQKVRLFLASVIHIVNTEALATRVQHFHSLQVLTTCTIGRRSIYGEA